MRKIVCGARYQRVYSWGVCPEGSDTFKPGEEGTFEFCCYPADTELATLANLHAGCAAGNGIMPGDRGTCHGERSRSQLLYLE